MNRESLKAACRAALSRVPAPGRLGFVAITAALLLLSCLHVFTGLADNHDFARDVRGTLAAPAGFTPGVSTHRYYDFWYDEWDYHPAEEPADAAWPSSFQVMLAVEAFVNRAVRPGRPFSLMVGSAIPRGLIALGFAVFAQHFYASQRERWLFLAPMTLLWALLYDSHVIAVLNSFYEEAAGLTFFVTTLTLVLVAARGARVTPWVLLFLSLALLSTAKPTYAVAPCILFLALWPLRKTLELRFRWLVAGCALVQATALLFFASPPGARWNAYQSVYVGAMTVLRPADLDEVTRPPSKFERACVGKSVWVESGRCFQSHQDTTFSDALMLYARHPYTWLAAAERVRRDGVGFRLDYLGKSRAAGRAVDRWGPFNAWSSAAPIMAWAFYPLCCALVGLLVFMRRRRAIAAPLFAVTTFSLAFGLCQYPLALADGFYELRKHCFLGNVAFSLATVFVVAALVTKREFKPRVAQDGQPSS